MKIKLGNIAYAVVQMVGNKTNGEGVAFSSEKINLCDIKNILFELFDKSLKYDDLKRLDFVGGVQLNPVYNFVSSIFEDENSFIQEANNLATYLYQQSLHPSIKNGEFYVMKINDCIVDGDKVDAVGLFKSELHDTVLKVVNNSNGIQIIPENGMSLKKLDKGCVVFNKNRNDGYVVAVLDSNTHDANYWTDAFLHAVSYKDSYHDTMNYIDFCKGFMASETMETVCKADKAIMMNKTIETLKSSEELDFSSFVNQAFGEKMKGQIDAFKEDYELSQTKLPDTILPSKAAVKKQATTKITTIKLDKNFDIKVKGVKALLEQGYDENRGMKYYKLYYEEEK